MSNKLFVASWVLLTVLSVLVGLLSLLSVSTALRGSRDQITQKVDLDRIEALDQNASLAVRGRRLTAATWALGFAILCAWVALVPYRRGERWAWWALLASLGVSQILSLLRVPVMGSELGAGASVILLGVLVVALLLGTGRVFSGREA